MTQLLLDPSMLLGEEGFAWLGDVDQEARYDLFAVSEEFVNQVQGGQPYTSADVELWGPLPDGDRRSQLTDLLKFCRVFAERDADPYLSPEVRAARVDRTGALTTSE